ncbi:hypothetical protein [Halobacillus kuroshimensis]|uniref:hypothetical protein n=1 Tax=Halobacillus kuroshimensis TaxID=302481 RepID=UPI0003F52AFC|nr:hypothetical protein [Halobacillus kuroshimensis]
MRWKGKGLAFLFFMTVAGSWFLVGSTKMTESEQLQNGSQMTFRTQDDQFEVYRDESWSPLFIKGINMGATLPGHFPGELPISKDDYLRWFEMIDEMGVNTIRIYTIHPPVFYEALVEYNEAAQGDPLYFMQGVWSPVNIMDDTGDALSNRVLQAFKQEIDHAAGAVYGDIQIPEQDGKASGDYTADAGPYLAAWHIGTEWSPDLVQQTNDKHSDDPAFSGTYFGTTENASPFESWLAELLDYTAEQESKRGWQHPMTFTNWMTTDPLEHPQEPQKREDMVSVDPTHIEETNWDAGYFASYHAYPYYPDFLRFTDEYDDVKNEDGKVDTYLGYLKDLKDYHDGLPVMISEFGVPSSRGSAHNGPLGRDQGGHSEQEQGKHAVDQLHHIYNEGFSGALLFTWQDEWFKKTWNAMPSSTDHREAFWFNALSAEESYGVLGMYPGKADDVKIDGELDDWRELEQKDVEKISTPLTDLNLTHDEGYVYVSARLPEDIDLEKQSVYIGVDSVDGGTDTPPLLQGVQLEEGLETMIRLSEWEKSEVLIESTYDFHTRLYEEASGSGQEGTFQPWKMAVSLPLRHPLTQEEIPFEDVEVGQMNRASLVNQEEADWEIKGRVLEMRIPWGLLGFSDPSTKQAVGYPSSEQMEGNLPKETVDGIRLLPWIYDKEREEILGLSNHVSTEAYPLYEWKKWQETAYEEKRKASYYMMKEALQGLEQ